MVGQAVNERTVSMFLSGENGHYDALLPIQEKERLSIFLTNLFLPVPSGSK
jgi:hypothetical protein